MCRLLGMISAAPASPEWGMIGAPHSLLVQSNAREKNLQQDGWGLAWYRERHAQWFKSPHAVFDHQKIVRQLASKTTSRVALAHIRRASNPRGLEKRKLLGIENAQPFAFKKYLFAHNGTLNIPEQVAATLGPWRERIKGVNDSEVLFWLLVSHLDDDHDFKTAFRKMVRQIWSVWRKLDPKPGREPYAGLNVMFSDGDALYAACHVIKRPAAASPSLCTQGWPFWRMCWRVEPGRAWIASEPLDRNSGWRSLDPGRYLKVTAERGRVRARIGGLSLGRLA